MTLTIELAPHEEQALEAKAARMGLSLDEYLRDLVRRDAETEKQALSPRKAAALRGYGMLKGSTRTVDDFLQGRREEAEMEMAQAARRASGEAS